MTDGEPDDLKPKLPNETEESLLYKQFDVLSSNIWDDAISRSDLNDWLGNFNGSSMSQAVEQLNALHLICNFDLFGIEEIRQLLRSVYRDLFRYPLIQAIRAANNDTLDNTVIQQAWIEELSATRFIGMGNPSESGAHLLYYFRQVNNLTKRFFIHQHEVFDGPIGSKSSKIAIQGLKRIVFIDDVLGSGKQAVDYSKKFVAEVKRAGLAEGRQIDVDYFVLFAKPEGLKLARSTQFDRVEAVHELQESELAFSANSRVYPRPSGDIHLENGRKLAEDYGSVLYPGHGLGFRDGQLLLGFRHNIPDNSLPIMWFAEDMRQWKPAFRRFGKIY